MAAVAAVGVMAVSVLGLWSTAERTFQTQLREELERLAVALATTVDPVAHAAIRDSSAIDSPAYQAAIADLRRAYRAMPGVAYVYTVVRDGSEVRFILDTATPGDADGDGREDRSQVWERYDDPDPALLRALGDSVRGVVASTDGIYSDEWGSFVSVYAPILRADGTQEGAIGVDIRAGEYLAAQGRRQRAALFGLIPSFLLAIAISVAVFRIRRRQFREARDLTEARSVAEAASRAKSDFLAHMSHEIRTPLTAIMGYADLLPGAPPSRQSEYVGTIRTAGEHLLAVVNDILDVSKVESGRLQVEEIAVELPVLLHDTVSLMALNTRSRGIGLDLELLSPIPRQIMTDPTRLRQILVNLISNASKFTDRGRVTVRVRWSEGATPSLDVDVADTGIGMTEEQAARLFQPFTQADSSITRSHGGTGLGLVLSRRLAEQLGGGLNLGRTAPGAGTTFCLTVLAPPVLGTRMIQPSEVELRSDAVSDLFRDISLDARILVAEDNPVNQVLVQHLLEKAGAVVVVAENGVLALAMLVAAEDRGAPFDLLVTDVQMPEMDGYELARTLRDRGSRIPIIALTAHGASDEGGRSEAAGCCAIAAKPINVPVFLALCAEQLRRVGAPAGAEL